MSIFVINRTKKTLTASAHMPYGAYQALVQLAKDHNGKIGETTEGFFTADFDSVATAKAIKTRFDADYAAAHAAYTPKSAPTKKAPKTTKKSKPSPAKKANKQTIEDYVRANDLCTLADAKAHGFKGTTSRDLWNYKVDLGLRVGKR